MDDAKLRQRVTETFERMTKRNETLHEEVKTVERRISEVTAHVTDLADQIGQIEKSIGSQTAVDHQIDYEFRLDEAEKTDFATKKKIREVQEACEKAIHTLCAERRLRTKIAARNEEGLADLARITDLAKELKEQPDQNRLRASIVKQSREFRAKVEGGTKRFQSEIAEAKLELSEAESEASDSQKSLNSTIALIEELESRIGRRDATRNDLEDRLQVYVEQQEQLAVRHMELQQNKSELERGVGDLTRLHEKMQTETMTIRLKYEREQVRMASFGKKVEQSTPVFKAKSEQLEIALRERQTTATEESAKRVADKKQAVDECKAKIEQMRRQNDSMQITHSITERDIETERKRLQELQDQYTVRFDAMQKIIGTYSVSGIVADVPVVANRRTA